MLSKYVLSLYVKLLLIVNGVLLGIVSSYGLMELLFMFKEKGSSIAWSYLMNLLPIAFFYLSPLSCVIALMILLNYVFSKKIDLIVQGFGISPLKFLLSVILFVIFISFLNLFMSFHVYAEKNKNLYKIEKEFKKRQEIEDLILRDAWFFKEDNNKRIYINFKFVSIKDGSVAGIFYVEMENNKIVQVLQGEKGVWIGDTVFLPLANLWNFRDESKTVQQFSIKLFDIKNAKPIGEKVEHLSLHQLLMLYSIGKSVGLNYNLYTSEVIRRFISSLSSIPIIITVLSYTIKRRNIFAGFLSFLPVFSLYWISFILVRKLPESTTLSPFYGLFPFAVLIALSLRSIYHLSKGFRV